MRYLLSILLLVFIAGCKEKHTEVAPVNRANLVHENMEQLTRMIVHDVFTPPVASRIYAYTSLACFEAMRFADTGAAGTSVAVNLNGFKTLPEPKGNTVYDFDLAATKAFFKVARSMIFSVDSFSRYENSLYDSFKAELEDSVYNRSVEFGNAIAEVVLKRAANDNYATSRSKPKFLGNNDAGFWRPTPPDYFDGVEYCWGDMLPFAISSADQFPVEAPPSYSLKPGSKFFEAYREVFEVKNNLTAEQKEIATFWDDNPFVMEHSGHMMFANKKITPGGHWIGITEIACKKSGARPVFAARAYTLTAIAIFDSFVACWKEKYRANVVRPVTVINEKIDPDWMPYLQTPPFPEYPSGHSTITRAAATVLTGLFGDNFEFTDTSDMKYIGMKRHFRSFIEAANEASISRLYGGIHYRYSLDAGAEQGRRIGEFVLSRYSPVAHR